MSHNSHAHAKPADKHDRKYKKHAPAKPGCCGSPICTLCRNSWKER